MNEPKPKSTGIVPPESSGLPWYQDARRRLPLSLLISLITLVAFPFLVWMAFALAKAIVTLLYFGA